MPRIPGLVVALPLVAAALAGCVAGTSSAKDAPPSWTRPSLGTVITVRASDVSRDPRVTLTRTPDAAAFATDTASGGPEASTVTDPAATDPADVDPTAMVDPSGPAEETGGTSPTSELPPEGESRSATETGGTHMVAAGTFELTVEDAAQPVPGGEGSVLTIGVEGGWELDVVVAADATSGERLVGRRCEAGASGGASVTDVARDLDGEPANGCGYSGGRTSGMVLLASHAGTTYVVTFTSPGSHLASDSEAVLGTWSWLS